MSRISLDLPTLQNWSCHNCGGCCRQHAVFITAEEKARIVGQNWQPSDGIPAHQPLFIEERTMARHKQVRLAHQPDGACVFLDESGKCRIHAKFGEAAKPLACRIYPYAFHPAGRKLAVSLRFSCPSVADNRGQSLISQRKDIQDLASLVVPQNYQQAACPPIKPHTQLDWPDTLQIVHALDRTLSNDDAPMALKLLRGLFWIDLIRQAKFQKIRGERLYELLTLLTDSAELELADLPQESAPPSKIALSQFRLLAGQYARKDTAATMDRSWKGRWRQLTAAMRLSAGKGALPPLGEGLAEVPRESLEGSFGPIPHESEEMLTRYFRVKVQGLHFFGLAYYERPLVEGFQSLALVLPVTVWLARWRAVSAGRSQLIHDDLREALNIVDHQHGYSEAFNTWSARRRVKNLVATEDLQKLILWYR